MSDREQLSHQIWWDEMGRYEAPKERDEVDD